MVRELVHAYVDLESELRTTTYAGPLVRDERAPDSRGVRAGRVRTAHTPGLPPDRRDRTIPTPPRPRRQLRRATTRSELSLRSSALTPRPQVHALPDHVVTQTVKSRQGPSPLANAFALSLAVLSEARSIAGAPSSHTHTRTQKPRRRVAEPERRSSRSQ
jgi:hypothetical protein